MKTLLVLIVSSLFLLSNCSEAADSGTGSKWSVTLYGGQFANENIRDVPAFFSDPKFMGAYIGALAVSREVTRFGRYAALEIEGEVVKHYTASNLNSQFWTTPWEFDAALVFRWLLFPWNKYVNTSFAIGDGPSYAAQRMYFEQMTADGSRRFLNYLMTELTLGLPQLPHWSLVWRLHHRSGIYGLLPGDYDQGSNFVCGGIKYSF